MQRPTIDLRTLFGALTCACLTAMLPAQLQSGHYLVGTQGWVNNVPFAGFNTVQMVSPYTGKATALTINGVPTNELPSAFEVENPAAFLMGTKVAAAPAEGNVYRVQFNNGTWTAFKLNAGKLGINVGGMVLDSAFAYVTGSAEFGTGAKDGQVVRISRANGAVTILNQFGAKYMTNGALGSTGGIVRIGTTLHIFTFNSAATDTENEHWTVTTTTPSVAKKLGPDLPMSKRFAGRGFASSCAVLDPVSGNIAVLGRWGELQFRDPATGQNLGYEQFPGALNFSTNEYYTELPRAAALNTATSAIAFGDHHEHSYGTASIDERRCGQADPSAPFANDVCSTSLPSPAGTLVSTVSALTYIPTGGLYQAVGDGCRGSGAGAPCTYVNSPPTRGNLGFAIEVRAPGHSSAFLLVGTAQRLPLGALGAPGCTAYLDPYAAIAVPLVNGAGRMSLPLAANLPTGATAAVQAMVLDPRGNTLGVALSEGRKARLQ